MIGVSKNTAASVREELEGSGQIDHFELREDPRTGELTQPATKPPKSVFAKTEREREEAYYQQLSTWENITLGGDEPQ